MIEKATKRNNDKAIKDAIKTKKEIAKAEVSNNKSDKEKADKEQNKSTRQNKVNQGNKKKQSSCMQVLGILKKQFPQAFKEGKEIKPLKIGVLKDLSKIIKQIPNSPISGKDCRRVLYRYTRNPYYQKALSEPKAVRIDLTGKPVSTVSLRDAEYARSQYERWLLIREKRQEDYSKSNKNKNVYKN